MFVRSKDDRLESIMMIDALPSACIMKELVYTQDEAVAVLRWD